MMCYDLDSSYISFSLLFPCEFQNLFFFLPLNSCLEEHRNTNINFINNIISINYYLPFFLPDKLVWG